MKKNCTLVEGKVWCCFSIFYSREEWKYLINEIILFYHKYRNLFHYFVVYFSDEQGEHIKVTFLSDIGSMFEVEERVNNHFVFFLKQNPSVHPKQFPFGEELWCYYPNNSLVWNQYKMQYPNIDLLLDEQFMFCLSKFLSVENKEQMKEEYFNLLKKMQEKVFAEQNGVNLAKWGCLIECLAQKSLIDIDADEQLTDVDDFLITLWQEMKVPYMGKYQFILWIGDYFLYRFCDKKSQYHFRFSYVLEQIVFGIKQLFSKSEYQVACIEPIFLFPVDIWRDLCEWLLHVNQVCTSELTKEVLTEIYTFPEIDILLYCDFPKDALRWKFCDILTCK